MSTQILTQSRLKELLHYDPDTGIFTWKKRHENEFSSFRSFRVWNSRYSGRTSGCMNGDGYIQIKMDKRLYRAHRLAVMYCSGKFPEHETDHVNGVRSDNRILNLRCVDRSANMRNQKKRMDNTSGVIGVSWRNDANKWESKISSKRIGYFSDYFEAICARKSAETALNYHINHGRK